MSLNESKICIFIRDMRLNVRIGLLNEEKIAPQPLNVTLECFVKSDYLSTAIQGEILDYAQLYALLESWEAKPHTELLETLAQETIQEIFTRFLNIESIRLCIEKPDIFDKTNRAGIDITIHYEDFQQL